MKSNEKNHKSENKTRTNKCDQMNGKILIRIDRHKSGIKIEMWMREWIENSERNWKERAERKKNTDEERNEIEALYRGKKLEKILVWHPFVLGWFHSANIRCFFFIYSGATFFLLHLAFMGKSWYTIFSRICRVLK